MKIALSAPAPDEGAGAPKSNGGIPAAMERGNRLEAEASGNGPHYNQGLRYGTPGLRYAVGDETPPEPSAALAKVKLEMATRPDSDLVSWITNHITLITGNASFPSPQPLPADLAAALTDFQTRLAAQVEALAVAKTATTSKDFSRKTLEDLMTGRGSYVQTASAGNAALIEGVGLGVKNPRTPVGPLAPPINIRIDLNGVPGVMKMRWDSVAYARGYLVQCSEDVQPRVWSQIKNTSKCSLQLENMEVGKTYVFRLASQGGSTGQSPWSAEVIRGAA